MRYALRQLFRTPGFTAAAVLTLALGIGANTAIFSIMDAVLMRGLPVPDPGAVYYLNTTMFPAGQTGNGDYSLTYPEFEALRGRGDVFQSVVAFVPLGIGKQAVYYDGAATTAAGDMVSGDYFSGLGVRMERGRGFTREDETQHAPVVVLSDGYWSARFARNPGVVGARVDINQVPFTVVGVAANGFLGTETAGQTTDFWIPFQNRPELAPWGMTGRHASIYGDPHWSFLQMVARLQDGVSPARAQAAVGGLFTRAAYQGLSLPGVGQRTAELRLVPAQGMAGMNDMRQLLWALQGMVALVLLIACANVAMMIVAKNAARQREFAVRMALGGGRGHLFRQLLAESALLAGLGAGLGWAIAAWATRALSAWSQMPIALVPDTRVLAATLAVAAAAAFVFGLAPLRSAGRVPTGLALRTAAASAGRGRAGQAVLVAQVALCLALLVCGGILVRSLRNLERAPLGMQAQRLLVFGVTPNAPTDAAKAMFWRTLLDRMRALPGVEGASLVENRPGTGWSNNNGITLDGVQPQGDAMVRSNNVGSDFFHVVGTPLLTGRDFSDSDTATSPKVAMVNRTFERTYLGGRAAVGHRLNQRMIVGVVADSKYTGADETPMPMAYYPLAQGQPESSLHVELRVAGADPAAMWPVVRQAVRTMAPELPLIDPMTQARQFQKGLMPNQILARLAMCFGLLAAVLVATGLYGTLAYKVAGRTSEIGVRMALGARRGRVLWMVLRESLAVAAVGIAVGLPLAWFGATALSSQLYGVSPHDAFTIAAAIVGLLAIAVAASLVPARRAAAVDPMVALRTE